LLLPEDSVALNSVFTGKQESLGKGAIQLVRAARYPDMRALTWDGDCLYASRGYELFRAKIQHPVDSLNWQPIGAFHPTMWRSLSASNHLSSRLFRDGFHALAVLPSGDLVAAVPGAIITFRPGQSEFRITHRIKRGTRPLHITAVPGGGVYWGEYFDNPQRDEVHIYGSLDRGLTWSVVYTFPSRAIRHVHNIVHDLWGNCLWILTGDYGDECRILRASYDFGQVETVRKGNQQARAVAMVPTAHALFFSSDTPLETNFIYRLDRNGLLSRVTEISSSSIYGCLVANRVFFSTMVEPGKVNLDRCVRIFGSCDTNGESFTSLLAWRKDRWPMRFFQYGNAFLPDGSNTTPYLAVTTIAVKPDDMVTSLYAVSSQPTLP